MPGPIKRNRGQAARGRARRKQKQEKKIKAPPGSRVSEKAVAHSHLEEQGVVQASHVEDDVHKVRW
jgi:hypothetical protein